MNVQAEWERLYTLYDEKDNEALLELQRSRGDLTDAAQDALDRVMKERGLEASMQPAEAKAGGSLVSEEAIGAGERSLYQFDDMYQANRAVELLQQTELEFRLINYSSMRRRGGALLELVVNDSDYAAAKALLHKELGLFPPPEGDTPDGLAVGLDDLIGVFIFDSETEMREGLAGAKALAEAGVSYFWHDGRDSPEGLADEKTIAIEVRQGSFDRANAIVEAALAVL